MCFHVVRDNRVLNADTARDEFRARERTSATLRQVYTNYSMVDIKVRASCHFSGLASAQYGSHLCLMLRV